MKDNKKLNLPPLEHIRIFGKGVPKSVEGGGTSNPKPANLDDLPAKRQRDSVTIRNSWYGLATCLVAIAGIFGLDLSPFVEQFVGIGVLLTTAYFFYRTWDGRRNATRRIE